MDYLVTYKIEGQNDVVQKFSNLSSPEEVSIEVNKLLSGSDFVKITPGVYGDIFGEVYIRASKVTSYVISKESK